VRLREQQHLRVRSGVARGGQVLGGVVEVALPEAAVGQNGVGGAVGAAEGEGTPGLLGGG